MGDAEMSWKPELLYVRRNAQGVIVEVSETKPKDYITEQQMRVVRQNQTLTLQEKLQRDHVEQQIREYAKKKQQQRKAAGD
jgi:parvulin-like peptidyl-prolyl isomerase